MILANAKKVELLVAQEVKLDRTHLLENTDQINPS